MVTPVGLKLRRGVVPTLDPPVVVRDDALTRGGGTYSCWRVEMARFFALDKEVPSWL